MLTIILAALEATNPTFKPEAHYVATVLLDILLMITAIIIANNKDNKEG